MSEQNMSNKEVYDLKRQEKEREFKALQRNRTTRRILLWGFILVLLGGSIWALVKFGGGATSDDSLLLADSVSSTDWVTGNKESKVILIEYGDFQCPACAAYYPIVKQIIGEHENQMQFVYRHFPLPQHQNAKPAAYAVEAAGKQGKFWEMYAKIFENQNDWATKRNANDTFKEYAQSLGLNVDQFSNDVGSEEIKSKVNDQNQSGVKIGINSTPTFFLNGKQIHPRNYDEFKQLIQQTISQNP